MNQRARDLIYRAFVISHIFPTLLLAVPLVLSPHAIPTWARKPLQFYLATYNDPLVGKKSYPGGWFGGMTLCEVALQLPYFLWTLTVPVGVFHFSSTLMSRRSKARVTDAHLRGSCRNSSPCGSVRTLRLPACRPFH
jgi:hypothetical protein